MRSRTKLMAILALALAVCAFFAAMNRGPAALDDETHTFDDVDRFKASIGVSLDKSPGAFTIKSAAETLGSFRLKGGFAVCSNSVEIEAAQYVELSGLIESFNKVHPSVTVESFKLLDSDLGVSDCQFRVLQVISAHAKTH